MAAAIAGPCEAAATPHDPSWDSVTTVNSSRSTALAVMGMAIRVPKASRLTSAGEGRIHSWENINSSFGCLAAHASKWALVHDDLRSGALSLPSKPCRPLGHYLIGSLAFTDGAT